METWAWEEQMVKGHASGWPAPAGWQPTDSPTLPRPLVRLSFTEVK